jgi:hypothetical protein
VEDLSPWIGGIGATLNRSNGVAHKGVNGMVGEAVHQRMQDLDSLMAAIERIFSFENVVGGRDKADDDLQAIAQALARDLAGILPIPRPTKGYPYSRGYYQDKPVFSIRDWSEFDLHGLSQAAMESAISFRDASLSRKGRAFSRFLDLLQELHQHLKVTDDRAEQTLKQLAESIGIAEGFMRPFLPVVESYERLDEIRDVKRAAQEAAGVIADIEIGTFFQRYAHQRRRSYQYWSFVIALCLTATVAASLIVLTRETGGTLAHELSRWTLVIP